MAKKLRLNSEIISNNQFKINSNGYDAFEVDSMLDKIVQDYELIENNVLLSKEEYELLNKKICDLNNQLINLTIELKRENERNKLFQDKKNKSIDNYALLERIGKLEKIINEKLHLSIEEIESFDPDDC